MCGVRNLFNNLDDLRKVIAKGVTEGIVDPSKMDVDNPLDFRIGEAGTPIAEAAYRFARHEPGTNVVLTGSGNLKHLEDSIRCINLGPLSAPELDEIRQLFGPGPQVGVG
jgi:aryl-alcohol dehydrogenase-like predicted oxidoreductase